MLLIIITLLVNLLIKTSESFTVVVPGDPIEAHVGSTVILSCWISPPENAEALEIRWYRHDFNNPIVFYRDGKIQDIQEYFRNRSSLIPRSDQSGGLKDGDVSLRLEKLTFQDEGSFHCYVSGDTVYDSREVLLKITDVSSGPWKALFFTLLICALLGLGLVGLFLYKYRERLRGKNPAGECCPEEMTKAVVGDVNTEDQRKHADERDANIEEPRKHAVVGDVNTEDQRKHADERDANMEEPRKHAVVVNVNIEEPRKHADCEDEIMEKLINEVETKLNLEETRKHEVERDVNIEEPRKHAVLGDVNIEELRKHAVEITIDRERLHADLILSEDCKIVRDRPEYNHTGEEFPIQLCAFGAKRFTSGRHYWEVELTRDNKPPKNYWLIGVVKDGNLTASDRSGFTPFYGYWFLYSDGPNGFHTNTNPPVKFSLTPRPERLGLLLDYDDGQLSFYNVTERKHLLTIKTRFQVPVIPLFNPGVGDQSELRILDCPKPAETPVKSSDDPKPVESAADSSQPLLSNSSDTRLINAV